MLLQQEINELVEEELLSMTDQQGSKLVLRSNRRIDEVLANLQQLGFPRAHNQRAACDTPALSRPKTGCRLAGYPP